MHVAQLALGERLLVALRLQLALQHGHALTVLGGEALGDLHRLLVLDLSGQTAAALGVSEALALGGELDVGALQGLRQLADGHLGLHHRFAHLAGEVFQIVRRRRRVERGLERGPETLEHGGDQLLRIVFAKNAESSGSTSRERHWGHSGSRRPCSAMVSACVKRVSHWVQRYS